MLGFSALCLIAYVMYNHFQMSITIKNLLTLALALTILFWGIHILLSPDKTKNPNRFEEVWDEPEIKFLSFLYLIVHTIGSIDITYDFIQRKPASPIAYWFIAILLILDIITIIVIYKVYAFSILLSIFDTVEFQIRQARNSMLIVALLAIVYKYTFLGTFLVFVIVVSFAQIFAKIFGLGKK